MSTSSAETQARSSVVVGFANSITGTLESTSWWTNNEGGITTSGLLITGIRIYGDRGIDCVRDGLVVTRLASLEDNTAKTFEHRVRLARATAGQRSPIGVVIRHDHPDIAKMGIEMEGEEYAILGQFLITDFWIMWKNDVKYIMVKLEKIDRSNPSRGHNTTDVSQVDCGSCKEPLVVRYKDRPAVCGYHLCQTTGTAPSADLQQTDGYDEGYLATREDMTHIPESSLQLLPDPPQQLSKEDIITQFEACTDRKDRINWKGWFYTTVFDDAPAVIRDVKDEMVSAISEIVGETPVFNELLAIENYPNMSMGWHQDGENGVGPVVASTSYGGKATMSFAMDSFHMVGKSRKVYLYDTILPGCLEEEKKRALMKKREDGVYDEEKYREEFRKLVDTIEAPSKKTAILKIPLPGTGAIMIQRGATLNQRFEHRVDNEGIARMVLTGRFIEHDVHQRRAKRPKRSEE